MPRQSHIPSVAERVAALERQGVTNRSQQARALGMGYSTLLRHLSHSDDVRRRPRLDRWIPWTVRVEHHSDAINRKLRLLAQAAEKRPTRYRLVRGYAAQWAAKLVEQGLDVTYSRSDGWSIVPANPDDWYIERLLAAAQLYITGLDKTPDQQEQSN